MCGRRTFFDRLKKFDIVNLLDFIGQQLKKMVRQRRPLKPESEETRLNREKRKKQVQQPSLTRKVFLYLAVFSCVVVGIVYFCIQYSWKIQVVTPLKQPQAVVQSGAQVSDRFWGTYRPGCYFGLRARSPQSPVFGLMWFTQTLVDNQLPLRHWCDQNNRLSYGWFEHDGVSFGRQEIEETQYRITTDFVKRSGGLHGGDWTAKISFLPKSTTAEPFISVIFYLALDGQGRIQPVLRGTTLATVQGDSEELGPFRVSYETTSTNIKMTSYLMTVAPGMHLLKETILKNLAIFQLDKLKHVKVIGLVGNQMKGENEGKRPNFLAYQAVFTLPFEMEVAFESGSFAHRPNRLIGDVFNIELESRRRQFEERFANTFKLLGRHDDEIRFGKAALSNLLGGIGYFYGSSIVQSKFNAEPVKYWPAPLTTATPSRSFFPRGFLWDEGFHNLLICQWDTDMCKDIIAHWLDLINVEGWIPREQILGSEARSRVPDEFVVQRNTNANPPTLFLPLQYLMQKGKQNGSMSEQDQNFFRRIYPRLVAWFDWFNVTQIGKIPGSYRWRGRDATTNRELNPKTLTSGLDDFPRASHPTDDERHVDLYCWMTLAAGVMAEISSVINVPTERYQKTHKFLSDNDLLDELHWSPSLEVYADFGFHTSRVKLERLKPKTIPQPGKPLPKQEKVRVVMDEPRLQFVDSFGYVGLFPFLTLILSPDSPKLGKTLVSLRNPELMWSKFGLRSLSRTAPLYMKHNTEHDPPYWRGNIWININYLALRALHHYSRIVGPHSNTAKELYDELKANLVDNMYREYKRTGFTWEQYSDATGQGHGSHPFNGWSSLVLLIMADSY